MTAKLKEYFDTLDLAYRAVDVLGGTGASTEYNAALDIVILNIEHLGGTDPVLRRTRGYPDGKPKGADDDAYFRAYMFGAGRELSVSDVADIQQVLANHNELLGEQADLYDRARRETILELGDQELMDAIDASDTARHRAIIERALAKYRAIISAQDDPQ